MNKKDIHSAAQTLGKLGGLARAKRKLKLFARTVSLAADRWAAKTPNHANTEVKEMRNPTTLLAIAISLVSREVRDFDADGE